MIRLPTREQLEDWATIVIMAVMGLFDAYGFTIIAIREWQAW